MPRLYPVIIWVTVASLSAQSSLSILFWALALIRHFYPEGWHFKDFFSSFFFSSSVAPGFEALKDQSICNKIMVKLIQNYSKVFEVNTDRDEEDCTKEESSLITAEVWYTHWSAKDSCLCEIDHCLHEINQCWWSGQCFAV